MNAAFAEKGNNDDDDNNNNIGTKPFTDKPTILSEILCGGTSGLKCVSMLENKKPYHRVKLNRKQTKKVAYTISKMQQHHQ